MNFGHRQYLQHVDAHVLPAVACVYFVHCRIALFISSVFFGVYNEHLAPLRVRRGGLSWSVHRARSPLDPSTEVFARRSSFAALLITKMGRMASTCERDDVINRLQVSRTREQQQATAPIVSRTEGRKHPLQCPRADLLEAVGRRVAFDFHVQTSRRRCRSAHRRTT